MRQYETYKNSEAQWVGKVPSNWKRTRIKFLLSRSSAGVWGDDEKGDANDIACFRVADFDYEHGCLSFDKLTYRNIEPKQLQGRMLSLGDLLIEKSGGGDATPVGRVVRYNYADNATCSNFVHSVSINNNCLSDYLYYYFFAMYANKENLLYFNQTTGIQNLKVGDYLSQTIFLPPLSEQREISSYLDKKCAEIHKAIATQQKRIELLQELRQNIITHAVTHGINPDALLKDSGVEWIGMVPKHWEVRKIKSIIKLLTDYDANGSFADIAKNCNINNGNPYAWMVRATDLENKRYGIVDGNNYCDLATYNYLSKSSLHADDILIAKRGEIGKSYLVPPCDDPMTLAPNTYLLLTNKEIVNNRYFFYYLQSGGGVENLRILNKSTTLGALYKDDVKAMQIPLPSIKEQEAIVTYIEAETAKLDKQIAKANRQISLLQELKQSIITEVVTGKRKVC